MGRLTKKTKSHEDMEEQGRLIEQKYGYWMLEREPDGKPYCFHCSVCDDDFSYIGIRTGYDYCPLCGARMLAKEEAEAKLAELKGE